MFANNLMAIEIDRKSLADMFRTFADKDTECKVVLNDDEYYCLGDNRPVSRDSRYYGAFSKKDIISTHLFILSPFKNFGYKK